MKRIVTLAALLFLALPLLVGACAPAQAGEIPIGISFPLTGPLSAVAAPDAKAVELAVTKINEAGGVRVGGRTYKLRPVVVDNKYSSEGEVGTANKLIFEDKVKITILWGLTLPHMTISEPAKSITFSGSPSTKVYGKYTFRILYSNAGTGPVIARWIKEKRPGAKVASVLTMEKDDMSGRASGELWAKTAAYYGLKDMGAEYLPPATEDFYPALAKVLPLNPDMLMTSSIAQYGLLAKQARERGYKGLIALQWHAFPQYIEAAGPGGEGAISTAWDPESELTPQGVKDFVASYRAAYKMEPSTGAILFYNGVYLAARAMEKAGTVEDTDKMVKALEAEQFDTPVGKAWFGGKALSEGMPRDFTVPIAISELKGGKIKGLARAEASEVAEARDSVFGK